MKWGKFFLSAGLAGGIALGSASAPAALLYNPVVTVVGDGVGTASGTGYTTSVYLYNNSTAGQLAPVASGSYNSSSSGTRLVNSVTATSEASLTNNPALSDAAAQGQAFIGTGYVYSAGYDAANGQGSVNSTATNASRSLGRMTVASSTVSGATVLKTNTQASAYNNNNIRGATGDDTSTNIYSAGTGGTGSTAGWRNFGSNTILSSSPTNVRTVELLGGKLFGSTGSGTSVGIYLIDPTGSSAATPFVTTGTSSNHSPYEFALFNDPSVGAATTNGYNVAYIADDNGVTPAGSDTGPGIEKWVYNGTSWSQAYILQDTATTYYRGLAGQLDAATGKVTLFATTSDGTKLQQVTDTGAASTFITLATAPTNDAFRGVALAPTAALPVPEPSTIALCGMGLGAALLVIRWRRAA